MHLTLYAFHNLIYQSSPQCTKHESKEIKRVPYTLNSINASFNKFKLSTEYTLP